MIHFFCSCCVVVVVKNDAKVQLKLDKNQFENEIIWKFENENNDVLQHNFQIILFLNYHSKAKPELSVAKLDRFRILLFYIPNQLFQTV